MLPSSRSQSAATTEIAGGTCELFRVKRLREIPDWWILGRCLPPTSEGGRRDDRGVPCHAESTPSQCNQQTVNKQVLECNQMVSQSVTHRACKTWSALGVQLVGKLAAAPQNPGGESVDDRRDERATMMLICTYATRRAAAFARTRHHLLRNTTNFALADSSFGQVSKS